VSPPETDKPARSVAPTYRRLLLALVILGLAATTAIFAFANVPVGPILSSLINDPILLVFLGAAAIANLGLRFLRWQYLLRRQAIRRPTRESLTIFLAGLGLGFVPLFAGEIALKGYLIGRGNRADERIAWTVALYERICDLIALCILAAPIVLLPGGKTLAGPVWWIFLIPPLLFLSGRGRRFAIEAAHLVVALIDRALRGVVPIDDRALTAELTTLKRSIASVGLGVAAWGIVCAVSALAIYRTGALDVGLQAGPLFAAATLLGGATLSPGGAGVTGSVLGLQLVYLGATTSAALASVVAVRASTFWFSLLVGQLALASLALKRRSSEPHFEAISSVYDAQIPPHVRDLLIERKVSRMLEVLVSATGKKGLDIGCGLGWYAEAMHANGAEIVGIDDSLAQARASRGRNPVVLQASAVELPFRDEIFDFAYAINVVHHLPSRKHQQLAFAEAARILKPGGVFFLHEINVINPLFRLYMGYVFPLIKRIDEGTERWLRPSALPLGPKLRLDKVDFFTFVPDFVPRHLLGLFLPVERWLESSPLRSYSAHFMATLRKTR